MKILIPAAGEGTRVRSHYNIIKPLVPINNKPMLQLVVENLQFKNIDTELIFLLRKEHIDEFSIDKILKNVLGDNIKIVVVEKLTSGAAATCLLSKDFINNSEELIIANSDQWLDWIPDHFVDFARRNKADGAIATFYATDKKWSYADVDELSGLITQVYEKIPRPSNVATCGVYYFSKGSDFVWAAEQMINKDIKTNGEHYLCPSYNELIQLNKKIYNYPIPRMYGIGTVSDIEYFLLNNI